jgi:hypothetical protein
MSERRECAKCGNVTEERRTGRCEVRRLLRLEVTGVALGGGISGRVRESEVCGGELRPVAGGDAASKAKVEP